MAVAAVLLSFSLIALSLMTAGVQAKALKLTFEYRSESWNVVDPGIRWESDGIVHIRGMVARDIAIAKVDTDCDLTFYGKLEFVLNINYFIETDERTGWGTWSKEGTFLKKVDGGWVEYLTGRIEGTFTLHQRGEQVAMRGRSAQGVGWGTGELEGYKVERFSYHENGDLVFGGTLLRPHV